MSGRFAVHGLLVCFLLSTVAMAPVAFAEEGTPAVSTAGVTDEVLCEVVVPAQHFPAGEAVVSLNYFTINPGVVGEFDEGDAPDSVAVDCVLQGGEIVRSDGPIAIARGDGTLEDVSPGSEAEARAGDAVIFLENELPQSITSIADGRSVVLSAFIQVTAAPACVAASNCPQQPAGLLFERFGTIPASEWEPFAGADVTLTFRRLELPPGASYALPPSAGTSSWYVQSGDLTVQSAASAGPSKYGEGRAFLGSSLPPDVVFVNAGDEPTVIWSLSLSAPGSRATPAAATPSGSLECDY